MTRSAAPPASPRSWTEDGRVDDVGSVCGADDEHVLLGAHAVHLGQDLVDDTVRGAAGVTHGTTSRLSNRVQLVKEKHARSGGPRFIENISDIGLALSEPHSKKLWTLDGYEVSLTLVGDGFGQ